MTNKYQIFLISDSTGETLDRIFLALQSQFANFDYDKKEFVFIRTEQQINKIINECKIKKNSIILYTIVDTKLAKFLANESSKNNIPCFGVLGNLILSFSKLLNQKATHKATQKAPKNTGTRQDATTKNTHRGARTHDHKVEGLALCRLS